MLSHHQNPTPAPATDPTISRTGHAQTLSILQHELDGWKKLAQELQSQTQTTNTLVRSPLPSPARTVDRRPKQDPSQDAYKSSYPSLSDPSPTPCAEHLTRIAQLEQDVRFRAIDADALALKNKSLSAELAQSRDCGAELREAKDEIRLVEEEAEREVARLAGEASRWREQVAGLGEKVAELEKELVVVSLPPAGPLSSRILTLGVPLVVPGEAASTADANHRRRRGGDGPPLRASFPDAFQAPDPGKYLPDRVDRLLHL